MLLEKTKAKMGDKKFFTYNAVSNKYQDLIHGSNKTARISF